MSKSSFIKKQNLPIVIIFLFELFSILVATLRPFLEFSDIVLLEMLLFFLQPLFFAFSIILLIVYFNKNKVLAFSPLIIFIVGVFLWILVQKFDIPAHLYLSAYKSRNMQIVDLVKSDSLPYEQDDSKKYKYINLPDRFKNLAKKGTVSVYDSGNNLTVFFYISRTFIGLEGLVYSENDTPPKKGLFNWNYGYSRKIDKNWYWAVFY